MARFDVTDAEWALIEPCLPVAAAGSLPWRVRDQFNGVLWRFRTGSGWRDVPERYGSWSTVCSRFNAWAGAGVFQGVPGPVGRPRTRPDAVAADKAYSSRANRAHLRRRRITAVIPEKTDQQASRKRKGSAGGRPVRFDPQRYKQRNTVECCFQKIKTWRGLATRYDKDRKATKPDCTSEARSCG